ncbi:hypothetical protein AVEN_170925-1 [Araneus ventricosus]|uniref:Uncharacterized protein n=1 Tax=Araneus ventricosus TaxID=182803 RepID=A0A4Y2JCX9_ARAVE|nr:hypothetical protein AVEN_170925-1 [Araneus ventricosus]
MRKVYCTAIKNLKYEFITDFEKRHIEVPGLGLTDSVFQILQTARQRFCSFFRRGHYERDRGYHYEKAYAYDRIRAHHDIGSNKGAHSDYKAHHGQEGHKDSGSHGAHGYSYFKKQDKAGGQGYRDHGLQYLSPHHHAYGK